MRWSLVTEGRFRARVDAVVSGVASTVAIQASVVVALEAAYASKRGYSFLLSKKRGFGG